MYRVLKNKKAVITGGSRGIGKTIAKAFYQNGAKLILVARSSAELESVQKELSVFGSVETITADVSKKEDVESVAMRIKKLWNGVDILVSAAAILGPIGPLSEANHEEWKKTLDVNLFGTFLMIHELIPLMKNLGAGKIINFVGGGEGARPNFSAYAASKGGIMRLTETLAVELKDFRIDVNAIAPGAVNTKLHQEVLDAGPEKAGQDEYNQAVKQQEGGGVSPEKAAELALFLASNASDGLTGKVISAVWDNYKNFPEHLKEIMSSDVYNYRRIKPEDRGKNW